MKTRIVSTVLIAALLAGCGGGGGGSALPTKPQAPLQSATAVTFNLKIPTKAKQVIGHIHKLGRDYVSPATLGVGVNFATGATATFTGAQIATPNLTFDLSTCGTNCTANADGSKTYTLSAPIPAGTYTFEITTWDSTAAGGTFSGNQLSQTIVANQTVAAGSASTTINFTLNGIASAISLSPIPGQSHVEVGSTGIAIIGNAPVSFVGNATDADGYIITGSGAPTMCLLDSSGTFNIATNGNMFTVNALSSTPSNHSVTMLFEALPPAGSGFTTLSQNVSFSPTPELWVSQSAGTTTGMWGYPMNGTTYTPGNSLDFIPSGGLNNSTMVVDTHGNLWVTNNDALQGFSAAVGSTPPTLNATVITLPGGTNSTVQGTALDAAGLLWVADSSYPALQSSGEVLAYDPTNTTAPKYTLTAAASGSTTMSAPQSIAIAPAVSAIPSALQGTIFVASGTGLDVLTDTGGVLTDKYPSVLAAAESAVAIGPDGTVWTFDGSNINAYALTMPGSTPVLTLEASLAALGMNQMATDPSGRVWLLQSSNGGANSYALGGCPATCAITAGPTVYPGSAYARGIYVAP